VIRVRSASPNRGGLRTTVACQQSRTGSERVMPRAAPLRLHGWQYRSECCCVSSRCGRKRSDASTGRWAWTAEALGHTPRGVSAPLRAPLGARRRSRSRSSASLLHRRPRSRHQLRNAQLRLIIETCQGRPAILALAAGTSVGLCVNRGHALLLPSTTGTVAGAPLRSARWLPRWTTGGSPALANRIAPNRMASAPRRASNPGECAIGISFIPLVRTQSWSVEFLVCGIRRSARSVQVHGRPAGGCVRGARSALRLGSTGPLCGRFRVGPAEGRGPRWAAPLRWVA
jgi:hypothetical protein